MKFVLPLLILGFASSSWSAIPSKISSKTKVQESAESGLALEILSMPEANRNQIAIERSEDLYPQLIQIAKNEKQSMANRWKALTLAALIGKDQVLAELESALKAKEWFMRNAALLALNIHHPLKARAAARLLIKDKALVVRSAAVELMGSELDSQSRTLFWEELNAPYNFRFKQSLWIRQQILSQLSEKPEAKESGMFVKALNEKDASLHEPAIAALERLTRTKLGAKDSLAKKRELWLQWAKAHPQVMTR